MLRGQSVRGLNAPGSKCSWGPSAPGSKCLWGLNVWEPSQTPVDKKIVALMVMNGSEAEGGLTLDSRSADKELKAVTPEK